MSVPNASNIRATNDRAYKRKFVPMMALRKQEYHPLADMAFLIQLSDIALNALS
jgi:hypothetical protein